MKNTIVGLLKALGLYEEYSVPKDIAAKFIQLDAQKQQQLKAVIVNTFFANHDLNNPEVRGDIKAHFSDRIDKFRFRHIPFLVKTIGLNGKKVLEIGCGTGSSSVALAEQGATVYGLDLDEPGLKVARERAVIYGVSDKIDLKYGNAMEVDKLYGAGQFDIAIFFASMEHMTHTERLASLKAAWAVLKKGGALCILGTPNRLWMFDVHTSFLPFYMWLPDDLAYKYSQFSQRDHFKEFHKLPYKENETEFFRWGRGVSFHEIDVAIKPTAQLKVLGDLHSFQRPKTFLQQWSYKRSDDYKYKEILAKNGPKNLSPAFYEYYLDVAVQKDE